MSFPRFSIVIPTRGGGRTLPATLKTCFDQEFDDFEVIVCDNCSDPDVKIAVDGFASPKIRYLRSETPLAMSSSWELAVSQARGEFVTVLGDDDGLMPHALRVLDFLLRHIDTPAIRWNAAFYLWPDIALDGEANYLRLPTGGEVEMRSSREMINNILKFTHCYSNLPMLYNSVVRRSLLDEIRQKTGRLFLTRYPDVCSGFLIAASVERYASTSIPMSVAGLSHKSTGVGHHMIAKQNKIGEDFLRLNAGEGVRLRRIVPDLHVFPVIPVADCFLMVKEALNLDDSVQLDRKTMIVGCVSCLRTDTQSEWHKCMAILRDSLADDVALQDWFDETQAMTAPNLAGHLSLKNKHLGFDGDFLHLDTSEFAVRDVHDCARLCGRLLGYQGVDLTKRFEVGAAVRGVNPLRQQVEEKEMVIRNLASATEERARTFQKLELQLLHQDARLREYSRRLVLQDAELSKMQRLSLRNVPRLTYKLVRKVGRKFSKMLRPKTTA